MEAKENCNHRFCVDDKYTYTCRICGENLTIEDIKNGAVFAGYSSNNIGRTAHKECWNKNVPFQDWKHQ